MDNKESSDKEIEKFNEQLCELIHKDKVLSPREVVEALIHQAVVLTLTHVNNRTIGCSELNRLLSESVYLIERTIREDEL